MSAYRQSIEQGAVAVRGGDSGPATSHRRSRVSRRSGDPPRAASAAGRDGSPRRCRRTSIPASDRWPDTSAGRSGPAGSARAARFAAQSPGGSAGDQVFVHQAGTPVPGSAEILSVAGEKFVAPFTGQHDGDVASRQGRDEIQRHARRMGDRLILVPEERRKRTKELAIADDDFVCLGADCLGDLTGVGELVEGVLFECHGEGLERPIDLPCHDGGDGAAVDSS